MRGKLLPVLFAAVFGVGFLVPEIAEAQYYGGRGYRPHRPRSRIGYRHRVHGYVGGQVMGMGILHQQLDNEGYNVGQLGPGGGVGLFGGVRLGPWVGLELNWTYTAHDESWECGPGVTCTDIGVLQIQTLTADFKLHIPTRSRIEPFGQVGAGFAFFGVDDPYGSYLFTSGPAFNLGGGLDVWLAPWVSLGGRILYRGMYFGEGDYAIQGIRAEENFVSGISVDLNATIHF